MSGSRGFCNNGHGEVALVTYPSGPHLRGDCPRCGQYVKFVEPAETMPVGQYKGKLFSEIPVSYLRWFTQAGGMVNWSPERKVAILQHLGEEFDYEADTDDGT